MKLRGRDTLARDCLELFALLYAMIVGLMNAPFTKVEESFNIQAMYDLLYKNWSDVSAFDHVEFPGVVPRTFIGPLILTPIPMLLNFILQIRPVDMLTIVRSMLGLLTVFSIYAIRTSLSWRYGPATGSLFTFLTVLQFHIMFYASRTLPNTFALILMNFAFAERILATPNSRLYRSLVIMSVACALFRSELCLYIFATLVVDLCRGSIEIRRTMAYGLSAAVMTAMASIAVDSYFWRRPCYPELEVFYFNVVLNKSSAWGTHPFHWYFTNALPRALGLNYFVAIWAFCVLFRELAPLVLPALMFVSMYSALPHKELRFVFYAIPVLNVMAALGMHHAARHFLQGYLPQSDKKNEDDVDAMKQKVLPRQSLLRTLIWVGFFLCGCAGMLASFLQTAISWQASAANYPAGRAMQEMHRLDTAVYRDKPLRFLPVVSTEERLRQRRICDQEPERVAKVHIDVKAATSGISQFLQIPDNSSCPRWSYSKREDVGNIDWSEFTHLITERPEVEGFCVIHREEGFTGINWRQRKLRTRTEIYVHRNKNESLAGCLGPEWRREHV